MLAGRSLRGLVVSEASACLIHGCSWPGVAHNRVKRPYAEENELDDPSKARDQNYVDRLKITARAGAGGNGSVSFWRSIAKGGCRSCSAENCTTSQHPPVTLPSSCASPHLQASTRRPMAATAPLVEALFYEPPVSEPPHNSTARTLVFLLACA